MCLLIFYVIALLETFWRCVLFFKEFIFSYNLFFCRTILVPIHKVLWRFESYRYLSILAFGPDDEVWKEIRIPYVKSRWPDGSLDFTNPLHISDLKRTKVHGKFFGTYEGRTPVMVVSDTDMVEELLLNTLAFSHRKVYLCGDNMHDNMLPIITGSQWRIIRQLVVDRFTQDTEIREAVPVVANCASVCIERLRELAREPKLVECGTNEFGAFAMDVMGRMLFGRPFPNHEDPNNAFVKNARKILIEGRERVSLYKVRYPEFWRGPAYCVFDPKAMDFFKRYIMTFLLQRTGPGTDFVQVLEGAVHKQQISMDELYANVTILLVLSFHSISFVVAVACWELSRNEKIQNRLIEEIDGRLRGYRTLTHADVDGMPFLEQVIKEALRKYPPAVRVERVCKQDTTLQGIPVKKGTVVAVPLFTLHRKPEAYPEPLLFDPDRFFDGRIPYGVNWLPFGEGHRKCTAWKFAMMEMKVLMIYLLSQFRLSASDDEGPLVFQSKKNILVADRIPFKIQTRRNRLWIPEAEPEEA